MEKEKCTHENKWKPLGTVAGGGQINEMYSYARAFIYCEGCGYVKSFSRDGKLMNA